MSRLALALLISCGLLLAGCPGERPTPPAQPDLASDLEALCIARASQHMDATRATRMCQCLAANHRRTLSDDELKLLLRDYRDELPEEMLRANNDVNQLILHDGMVAERCLEDPDFRLDQRTQWPARWRVEATR